jgi:hypothetical protein
MNLPEYCKLYDFVDFKGKEIHLHPNLLKIVYKKAEGGSSIYSITLPTLCARDIEKVSAIAIRQLEKTL